MEIKHFRNVEHSFNYCDHPVVVSSAVTLQLTELLNQWQSAFLPEETFVWRNYGVPSLFVRFDGVIHEDRFQFFEVQEAPEWLGYAAITNPSFRMIRDTFVRDKWPKFSLLMHEKYNRNSDDPLWMEKIDMREALDSDKLLHIRYPFACLNESQIRRLLPRSMRLMYQRNDKNYGLTLGWWRMVTWQDTLSGDSLPWDEGFALKPLRGWGSKDVMLWKTGGRAGHATRTQIVNALQRHGAMILQPFFEPMRTEINGRMYNVILRPYFGFNTVARAWEPMGGVWAGRPYPNLRIHGSSDAISGPLFME